MSDNQKFLAGLLLGAATGVAITLFLNSEKGKQLVQQAKESTDDLQAELKERFHSFDGTMNELLEKGKSLIEEMEQRIKTKESTHEQG